MNRLLIFAIGLVLLAGCTPQAARPAPPSVPQKTAPAEETAVPSEWWSIGSDFSPTANPNGVWSWGQSDAAGNLGSFTAYPLHVISEGCTGWCATTDDNGNVTSALLYRNSLTTAIHGVQPGEIALHPGPDSHKSILRWTAPRAGTVRIEGCFGAGDLGSVNVYVFKTDGDGQATMVLLRALNTLSDQPFRTATTIQAGETIDFTVGNTGHWEYDSTPLAATIVLEPDREPAGDSRSK